VEQGQGEMTITAQCQVCRGSGRYYPCSSPFSIACRHCNGMGRVEVARVRQGGCFRHMSDGTTYLVTEPW